ncbi:uracil-DNA glycosylase [Paenibacillus aurantius]|uniref:Uracil-DNA glycosylase n=1 Tax=Paenibacillus aurantius TaxID=2918900 RepID=A0AA96LCL5_9BACL|nr:uracil-DNA glycosylase [Paenibacillus aurantius]WNQ10860.1 uracil-DNA glycosylase [Paenibacillus aurantius]
MPDLPQDWLEQIGEEFKKPYYLKLRDFLKEEYRNRIIHPDMHDIFSALQFTPYREVKAVILGQDPYHGPNQAHGLSFSVKPGVAVPPSLQNIFKELHADLGLPVPNNGYLVPWAKRGVLLLNTVLTVRDGAANSHRGKGWELFTDEVIRAVSRREEPVVFLLWGANAQEKTKLIDTEKHHIIRSPHPSPLSAHRGFLGSRPFSRTNEFLQKIGAGGIDWRIADL